MVQQPDPIAAHVAAIQPTEFGWRWLQVPATITEQRGDEPPTTRQVTLIGLELTHVTGVTKLHFTHDTLDRLADQAKLEAVKARSGISTASELPSDNGGRTG